MPQQQNITLVKMDIYKTVPSFRSQYIFNYEIPVSPFDFNYETVYVAVLIHISTLPMGINRL
jgi:hypothetical protein